MHKSILNSGIVLMKLLEVLVDIWYIRRFPLFWELVGFVSELYFEWSKFCSTGWPKVDRMFDSPEMLFPIGRLPVLCVDSQHLSNCLVGTLNLAIGLLMEGSCHHQLDSKGGMKSLPEGRSETRVSIRNNALG